MNPFNLLTKTSCKLSEAKTLGKWKLLVGCYTLADRVKDVFDSIDAEMKVWFVVEEYKFEAADLPSDGSDLILGTGDGEHEVLEGLIARIVQERECVCIDATGFIRPHLLYLIKEIRRRGVIKFDVLYSEPAFYSNKESTSFSKGAFRHARQVSTFEGVHEDPGNDVLIVGAGYDIDLIQAIVENKSKCRLINFVGFPSLVADMYQENLLCLDKAGLPADWSEIDFVPANDPFITAGALFNRVYQLVREGANNIYLSPLSTKPVALGFALFYCLWCEDAPASIIFAYKEEYAQNTSVGVSRIWRFEVDFDLLLQIREHLGDIWQPN